MSFIFVIGFCKVLITKIRSTKSAETHNYKKATKALLVLIPLLGITFCLDMINPSSTGLLVNIYKFSKVVIISTQVSTTIIIICNTCNILWLRLTARLSRIYLLAFIRCIFSNTRTLERGGEQWTIFPL